MHNHYTIIRQVFFIWHIMLQYTSQNILRELSIKNTNLYKEAQTLIITINQYFCKFYTKL